MIHGAGLTHPLIVEPFRGRERGPFTATFTCTVMFTRLVQK